MAKNAYIGVSGVARKVKSKYIGVSGVARKITKGYMGVGGVARQFWPGGEPVGGLPVGSIVSAPVNGVSKNFRVVHQGRPSTAYDASCDGTWLLMEEIYEKRVWDSTNHDYRNSDIHSYMNNTFINLFPSNIVSAIKEVKLPYRRGTGTSSYVTSGSDGLPAKVFLLSYTEVGYSGNSTAPIEGAVLSYFNGANDSKRIAYLSDGTTTYQWLRTPRLNANADGVFIIHTNGSSSNYGVSYSYGMRPAFVLPSDALYKVENGVNVLLGYE